MFNLFSKKKVASEFDPSGLIPSHIGVIMDGNGRWAQKRGLPRSAGHKVGIDKVRDVAIHASKLGVKIMSVYVFSTENWKRDKDEVDYLMGLPGKFFDNYIGDFLKYDIKIAHSGFTEHVPGHTLAEVQRGIDETKDCKGMILNLCFNYGSQPEIVHAIKEIGVKLQNNEITLGDITENLVDENLFTGQFAPELRKVDYVIRTSGEQRLSNFLMWQCSYAEFYFPEMHWPSFTEKDLEVALADYQKRDRRYGGVKK
ncbi:MAG: isoprenyl transferase [Lactobacillales bacterium]|jgi:undecaprenyl diphosphate synthase|nr:isoprenyl transferase [Lactobacillales bacterium]